jgi:ABC-2 type transport system ATP-binding protein
VLAEVLGEPVQLEPDPAALNIRAPEPERVAAAIAQLAHAGIAVNELSLGQPSMDEVFLALTGHPADDTNAEDAA